jgi:hypothetical protein
MIETLSLCSNFTCYFLVILLLDCTPKYPLGVKHESALLDGVLAVLDQFLLDLL